MSQFHKLYELQRQISNHLFLSKQFNIMWLRFEGSTIYTNIDRCRNYSINVHCVDVRATGREYMLPCVIDHSTMHSSSDPYGTWNLVAPSNRVVIHPLVNTCIPGRAICLQAWTGSGIMTSFALMWSVMPVAKILPQNTSLKQFKGWTCARSWQALTCDLVVANMIGVRWSTWSISYTTRNWMLI